MALTDKLTAIADAIRAKAGTSDAMTLAGMAEAIAAISAGGGAKVTSGTITMSSDELVLTSYPSTSYVVQHGLGEVPSAFILWTPSKSWNNSLNLYIYNYEINPEQSGKYGTSVFYAYHTSAGAPITAHGTSMHVDGKAYAFLANAEEIAMTNGDYEGADIYMRNGVTYYWVAIKLEG